MPLINHYVRFAGIIRTGVPFMVKVVKENMAYVP